MLFKNIINFKSKEIWQTNCYEFHDTKVHQFYIYILINKFIYSYFINSLLFFLFFIIFQITLSFIKKLKKTIYSNFFL